MNDTTPQFSLEFFPPKTEAGKEKLQETQKTLFKAIQPAYASVTFGAGGSTQDGTFDAVMGIQQQGIEAAPHLSCIGSTRDNIAEILQKYRHNGIHRIVALRGDMPSGMGASGEFRYANELVEFIRQESGDHFHIEVAAYPEFHPQAPDAFSDLKNFKRKVEAGANSAITQYFYNIDAYLRFNEECVMMGLDLPIVPGIMPITNYTNLARFSEMCGAEIPRWIRERLIAFRDDTDALREFGLEVTTRLCQDLLSAGAPGIHFYTMNQSGPTLQVYNNLEL
ncbi:MAG: methylenetetrahydrofolate reductase [NAD(P)H] [Gammaproteobacteria bacterium]|jgi:methylenetetrahydrofolate reductase (NADPH)|nr:methylenetetrahydrofolate reductase [NAD(P)H] [Gammaproteobacteria bacterium]MBT3488220.1 methylenetetrahydrofolate reductase [NAD(P)H] [Gammaproteobacteria bacterium]MBT3719013.1 methylenetetrahydrofolate reductase [NAD(P)H] [Gammaproteobacteria bacterium]MBT3843867.1 methylenetetrahydrofolate reductase [NAD(P)H] [Gammaproteobacteria bacterium]MBT3892429.1 methylenetetrahydrofolate reductase [NAD(P)H] [Gammaproteobacteria bacterium]